MGENNLVADPSPEPGTDEEAQQRLRHPGTRGVRPDDPGRLQVPRPVPYRQQPSRTRGGGQRGMDFEGSGVHRSALAGRPKPTIGERW